ncbi:hypothetical protein EVAR_31485_1 [Eumeta japonica]|uniref:Uncharacterized protein n=1 Tax=Eumeta variegata TaxID=151549 RepID=A0A4C1WCV0_EUMVA|nr:hypothetical protein EVAR_31485_1 [Eumeta japonica]
MLNKHTLRRKAIANFTQEFARGLPPTAAPGPKGHSVEGDRSTLSDRRTRYPNLKNTQRFGVTNATTLSYPVCSYRREEAVRSIIAVVWRF